MNPVRISLPSLMASISARKRDRRSGSRSIATCSSRSRSATSRQLGTQLNGWKVCSPRSSDTVRAWTCGWTRAPRRLASRQPASIRRQSSGATWFCVSPKLTGRPVAAASRPSSRPPCPARRGPRPARRPARARTPRCRAGRARRRSRTARPRRRTCRARAHRRSRGGRACATSRSRARRPRSPSDTIARHGVDVLRGGGLVRRAPLAHDVRPHRAVGDLRADVEHEAASGRARRGTRGSVSQLHSMPSDSAAPGMSSTPSMRPISQSWRSGAAGAKPTPQLPMTRVVTPCQHVGVRSGSQVTWPS